MKKSKLYIILGSVATVVVACIITIVCVSCAFSNPLKKASKNLTTYNISASLSTDYVILGKEEINYVNKTGSTLKSLSLHLYPRAFRQDATIKPYTKLTQASCFPDGDSYGNLTISSVKIGEQNANWIYAGLDSNILQIEMPKELKDGKKIKLNIGFEVVLPKCTHRLGYYNGTINVGNWYPVVCGYREGKFDTTPYYATGDPFFSECANYNVNFSYPAEYACYATGNQVSGGGNASGVVTNSYKALAVRDFALVLTNKGQQQTVKAGKTNVTYVGYQGDDNIAACAKISGQAVSYFGKQFGTYPYQNLVVIKSAFLHGGMEYPNIVIVSDAVDDPEEFSKVIVHEIAHQWWYGLVGNNEAAEAWLDESLAEYSTCLFFEDNTQFGIGYDELIKDATGSYLIYVDIISSLSGKVNTAMNLSVNEYINEYEYTYMVYVKGVIMFDSLRQVVGRDKLVSALKKYCKKYRFKIATGNNLIEILDKNCHKDTAKFMQGWLDGSNVIASN